MTKETAFLLESNQKELSSLNWQTGESNTDMDFSKLAKKYCLKAFEKINDNKKILLKIEVPDLNLNFKNIINGESVKRKIELKSSIKGNGIIPGSMIKSLDINTWTIFCNRKNNLFKFRYGRYFLGVNISTHETFQDRSPRYKLKFDQFQKTSEKPKIKKQFKNEKFWELYADAAINRLLNPLQHSWQDDLIKSIIKKVLNNPKKFKDI